MCLTKSLLPESDKDISNVSIIPFTDNRRASGGGVGVSVHLHDRYDVRVVDWCTVSDTETFLRGNIYGKILATVYTPKGDAKLFIQTL